MSSVGFSAVIEIIGINPYVEPPSEVLEILFRDAGREKSPIPVQGALNGAPYRQTLVKYAGVWRLYLNGPMLRAAKLTLGEITEVTIAFDVKPRTESVHPDFAAALAVDAKASAAFLALTPSRRKEILRYLNMLKTDSARAKNIDIVLARLKGQKPLARRAFLR